MDSESVSGAAYYADNYPDYERQNSAAKLAFYMGLLERWVERGSRIFELGVGLGLFLKRAEAHYQCVGCEPNPYGAQTSRARVPGVVVHKGSFECMPTLPPQRAVVAWDVLEHIPDLDRALQTIYSRLAPGGVLLAAVPVYDSPLGLITRLLDRDPTHLWKLSRHDWLNRVGQHGFEIVDRGGIVRKLVASRWYVHVTRPQFFLLRCSSAFYFVARKPL
jgi:SAM-dependent methyltransferase